MSENTLFIIISACARGDRFYFSVKNKETGKVSRFEVRGYDTFADAATHVLTTKFEVARYNT